jgi:hypothetical protein
MKIRLGEQCAVHSALWTTETSYLDDKYCWLDRGARYADNDVGYKRCVPIQADWLQTVEVTTKDTDCGETGEILIGTDNAKIVLKQSTSDVQRQTQKALGIGFRRLERKGWPVPFK